MEASIGPRNLPAPPPPPPQPNIEKIKQNLLKHGVFPTPKIIHNIRKKELQKSIRRSKRKLASQPPPLTESQKQAMEEETHFQTIKAEYKNFTKSISAKTLDTQVAGKPWEGFGSVKLRDFDILSNEFHDSEKLKSEPLRELSDILERDREKFRWLLDDDIELKEGWLDGDGPKWVPPKPRREAEAIRFLVDKLSKTELDMRNWKFSRMMKHSGLLFTEGQLMKIVEGLGNKGQWKHAISIVEWVYNSKEQEHFKSRFVYTKLLAVLGKARRPREALQIFDLMREDRHLYPDMPAYRSLAVTLGQAGLLKELLKIIEDMKQKPKRVKNMRYKNWDPILQPDIVVFNAVMNACVARRQWKAVSWVFEQVRHNALRPNGATYGLAMEVMLSSGKHELVHSLFEKMKRSGEAPKALTYKVLVRAFWEEGKVDEAVQAVRSMERRGVVGSACVYYELACCLCNKGRWQEAIKEVEKLKKLPHTKPLGVTYTGMIMSSMDGGYVRDCISVFQQIGDHDLDIGIINMMLRVYGRNDMFSKARELFETTKRAISDSLNGMNGHSPPLTPDAHTYSTMLKASASALQWEYFEYIYREMVLSGHLLDQSKHGWLLVEASKAGKGYMLEHAFDSLLEADEIPDVSFFNELVCHAITQHDYEKVVRIIKIMAYAPFQVSEGQWTDLFKKNEERMSGQSLKELLEVLCDCDLPMEATVKNLSRSLSCYCRSSHGTEISGDAYHGTLTRDGHMKGSADVSYIEPVRGLSTAGGYDIYDGGDDSESEMLDFLKIDCDDDRRDKPLTRLEFVARSAMLDDDSGDEYDDYILNETENGISGIDEMELGVPIGKRNNSDGPDPPSADEILKSWKQSRNRDDIFR